ncbi:unnamed protein product, partial [Symbiodinium microadriaticum]
PLPGQRATQMSSALCRCICGTGKKDQFELQPTFSTDFNVDALGDTDEAPFSRPPLTAGRLTFSLLQQPLRGAPIRQGKLWYLSSEDQVDSVHFSLHVNGFSFWHEGAEVAISLSPFVLVRNCKFQSGYNSTLSDIKIFKISLFAHSACYYFGVRSTDERWAEDERSRWVLDVSRAVRLVTQSLFPPYRISCDPQQGAKHTATRLMAGYVVHHDDVSTCSVVYCELHAHQGDLARVTMYENDLCQVRVAEIDIYESATCSEKIGINCSCFSVEDHQFSSRTLAERKLWLRAISNVRVKLQNRAPDPTKEELTSFRTAIKEHLSTIRAALEGPGVEEPVLSSGGGSLPTAPRQRLGQTMDPLLQRCHARRPPLCHGMSMHMGYSAEDLQRRVAAQAAESDAGRLLDLKGIQVEIDPLAHRAAPRPTSQSSLDRFKDSTEAEEPKGPEQTGSLKAVVAVPTILRKPPAM